MRLVVAEKPSVARDLARVLGVRGKRDGFLEGDDLAITWCFGHLVELEEPAHYDPRWQRWSLDTLPMLPEEFAHKPRKGAVEQFRVVKGLLRDKRFAGVVNACDAGREGELIFRQVYELAGSKLPVQRLWLSSLTEEAIRKGWGGLRPSAQFDPLADAARCRSEADWLVGLNATRALTCLARTTGGGQVLSVGRVQTPTLAMIVGRDGEIEAFVPQTFWRVTASFATLSGAEWDAAWFQGRGDDKDPDEGDETPAAERLADEASAVAVAAATEGRAGLIETADRKRQNDPPPFLYDLTSLQRRANQRYGFDAGKTLAIAQTLYEQHKLISYPRTDARHLTPDQVGELPAIVQGLAKVPVYAPFAATVLSKAIKPGRRVVDAEEVGDHHAIIPTGRTPDAGRLSPDEKRLFDLVARRFLAALSPDAVLERALIVVAVDPGDAPLPDAIARPLRFRARGRVIVEEGWRAVDPPGKGKDTLLPRIDPTEEALAEEAKAVSGQTRPPRPYDDASILKSMETAGKDLDDAALKRAMRNAGLGTPATRAAILATLVERGYVERRGKEIRATDRGRGVIDALPVEELKSAELTARWEARLAAMADGKEGRARFMADVALHTRAIVAAIAVATAPPAEVTEASTGEVLGKCPACGEPVREERAVFACATGRACPFVVFKKMAGRAISPRMVKTLLKERKTPIVKGFKSKKGKPFEAGLALQDDGKVVMWFEERGAWAPEAPAGPAKKAPKEAALPDAPTTPVGMPCPVCGVGRLVRGRAAWGCERWTAGCRYVLPFERDGGRLSDADAAREVTSATRHPRPPRS